MNKLIVKYHRAKLMTIKSFGLDLPSGGYLQKDPGETLNEVPPVMADYLVDEGVCSRSIVKPRGIDPYSHSWVRLDRQFTTEELSHDGVNTNLSPRCVINWRWINDKDQFDGLGRIETRSASWVRDDIAKILLDDNLAVLTPWGVTVDREARDHSLSHVGLGNFIRTHKDGPRSDGIGLGSISNGIMRL